MSMQNIGLWYICFVSSYLYMKTVVHILIHVLDCVSDDVQDGRSIFTSSIPADVDKSRTNKQTALVHIQLRKYINKIYM